MVVGIGDGVHHLNGVVWHIRIPFVVLVEILEAAVGLRLADIVYDIIDDCVGIAVADNAGGARGTRIVV